MRRGILGIVALLLTTATAEAAMGEMDLSWTDTSGNEDGFTIERAVGVGGVPGTFTEIARTAPGVTAFVDRTGLVHATQYCYRVRAFNAGGFSGYATVSGGTATFACALFQTAPPAAPSGLVVR